MQIRILGCSGGIGGNLRTTSMLLDHDVLVDAGTGVGDLTITELLKVDHVLLTHSHLDHITSLPFLVDTVGPMRETPITVHCAEATHRTLQEHIFNWKVWPDFTEIPSKAAPYLRYSTFSVGDAIDLGGRRIKVLPANHVVPAVGFQFDSGESSLVFTGDTTVNDALWKEVNKIENLRYLIIETAFPNMEKELAIASKHLCPSMLAEELGKMGRSARVFVTHLKPGAGTLTMQEVEECAGRFNPRMLSNGQVFKF
ncbi:MAG TPA: 3',5'-cyclic-nucleotide phosphodiesterase [Burkholderiales bacterium]|nr:3',5'-cyclic-nucleotide phosphodiesterase [Burkholderiales bacterium]